MSAPGIAVAGLRKRYRATRALDDMSFTVHPGPMTGFVGPNEAGKSTTMRVILGLDARADAAAVLANAGVMVAATVPGVLMISCLCSERAMVLLTENAAPFSEVSAHRATLEEAYQELTGDTAEFRVAPHAEVPR